MSDIVERLRRHIPRPIDGALGDLHEAADLIVSLRGELAKARKAALEEAAKVADEFSEEGDGKTDGELWIAGRIATAIRSLREEE